MVVAFDTVGPSSAGQANSTSTTATWTHIMSAAGNGLVLVGVACSGDSATVTATFNGVSMTSLAKRHSNDQTAGFAEVFYLVGPSTGSQTVLVTASSASDLECGSLSFTGVDQSTPLGTAVTAAGATTTVTASVTVASGNYGVGFSACGAGLASPSQTNGYIQNQNVGSAAGNGAGQYGSGSGGSMTLSWSTADDWWADIVVEVKATGSGGGAVILPEPIIVPMFATVRASTW